MLPNQIEYEKLYQYLRQSEYGLSRPVFEILVAALIKEGYLVGYKGISPVDLETCRLPISQAVDTLCTGQLISEEIQAQVMFMARGLFTVSGDEFNIGVQETVWQKFIAFQEKTEKALHHVEVEIKSLSDLDTFNPDALTETKHVLTQMKAVAQLIDPRLPSKQGLERLVQQIDDPSTLFRVLDAFDRIVNFVKNQKSLYLEILQYLTHPALVIPESPDYVDLIDLKQETMPFTEFSDRLILFGGMDQLSKGFLNFRDRFIQMYIKEHQRFQEKINIQRIETIRQSPGFRLLYRFSQLPNVSVSKSYQKIDQQMDKMLEVHCLHLNENELRRYPRCRCDFCLGMKLPDFSIDGIPEQIIDGLRQYLEVVQNDSIVRPHIEKYLNAMVNLERDFPAGKINHLLHLDRHLPTGDLINQLNAVLDIDVVNEIKQALKTNIRFITLDLAWLIENLQSRYLTRGAIEQAVQEWFQKGPDPVKADSYIHVINSQQKD